jgi:hypothetical protein
MEEHAEAPVDEITLDLLPGPAGSAVGGRRRAGIDNG